MSAKLFTLIATLAVIAHWSQVNACKCRVLPDPGYCRTGFVGLIKITDVTVIEASKHYSFEVLSDLSYGKSAHKLQQFSAIETNKDSAACGVYLEKGKTYLLGGHFDEVTHQPKLFSCSAYWRLWDLTGEKSTARLEQIKQECDAFHKNPTINN